MVTPASSPRRSPENARDSGAALREASSYLGLGMQLAGGMALFMLGGYALDRWLGTMPWLMVIGGLLGMGALFVKLFSVSAEMGRKSTEERARKTKEAEAESRAE